MSGRAPRTPNSFCPRYAPAAAAAAVILSVAAGCAVGPNFVRPAAPSAAAYAAEPIPERTASAAIAGGEAQRFVEGLDVPGQWWTLFHSQPLNDLVAQSLKANPGLAGAEAALRQAMELVHAQQGFFFPTVQAGLSATRQRNAVETLSPTLTSGAPVFNLYTAQVSVGYTLDVFGGNRRQVESLQAQSEFQRYQLEATYLTLTSNVVAAAVQEASLRAQIDATQKVIGFEREALELLRIQYNLGAIAMSDVVAQEALLAQTLATLPGLQKQLAAQRSLLTALLGRLPSEAPAERFELAMLDLPQDIPVSLPSRLVDQRPDVRAAEAQLHSASAQIGVAIANMLPQITLGGAYGGTSTQFATIFQPGNIFWSLAGNAVQTLFAGGTLLHRERAAVAAFDQAAAQYKSTVITAFQNVSDSLHALQYDADTLSAQLAAERAAFQSLEFARKGLELGSASYLAVLSAQQAYQLAVINLTQARASRLADTVALFQALGGGWWNREDVASAQSRFNPDSPAAAGCGRLDAAGAASMPWASCGSAPQESNPRPAAGIAQ